MMQKSNRPTAHHCLGLLAATMLVWAATAMSSLAQTESEPAHKRLKVYQPQVRHVPIYLRHPGGKPYLRYNHDSDIVRFKGKFYAVWNANEDPHENVPEQYNFLSVSEDFENWSPPIRPFMSESGAVNPIDDDMQWQPNFINYRDEVLYCAWCERSGERRTVVSSTTDGKRWTNRVVASAPEGMEEDMAGFPTTHGTISAKGTLLFPCSLPPIDRFLVHKTRYGAMLRSEDGGKTWQWSEPIEAVTWSEVGEDPKDFGGETIILWEPVVFQQSDGRIGLLVRNSTAQANPEYPLKPEHTILYAYSEDDGKTWSKARPIQVESTFSRMWADAGVNNPHSLMMVMNDWNVYVPEPIPRDRLNLALFLAPVPDPNLLLPGPVIQPPGGRAYYANGFVHDGKLYQTYTYDGIFGSVVESLPTFDEPFLLPRGGRQGLKIEGRTAYLQKRETTLGLVLTPELARSKQLRLKFRMAVDYFTGGDLPVLVIGGKTQHGVHLRAAFSSDRGHNCLQLRRGSETMDLTTFELGEWIPVEVQFDGNRVSFAASGNEPVEISADLWRKIAFGGLYVAPEFPQGLQRAHRIRLDLDSIVIE